MSAHAAEGAELRRTEINGTLKKFQRTQGNGRRGHAHRKDRRSRQQPTCRRIKGAVATMVAPPPSRRHRGRRVGAELQCPSRISLSNSENKGNSSSDKYYKFMESQVSKKVLRNINAYLSPCRGPPTNSLDFLSIILAMHSTAKGLDVSQHTRCQKLSREDINNKTAFHKCKRNDMGPFAPSSYVIVGHATQRDS